MVTRGAVEAWKEDVRSSQGNTQRGTQSQEDKSKSDCKECH